jgi:hypothetical protein
MVFLGLMQAQMKTTIQTMSAQGCYLDATTFFCFLGAEGDWAVIGGGIQLVGDSAAFRYSWMGWNLSCKH